MSNPLIQYGKALLAHDRALEVWREVENIGWGVDQSGRPTHEHRHVYDKVVAPARTRLDEAFAELQKAARVEAARVL